MCWLGICVLPALNRRAHKWIGSPHAKVFDTCNVHGGRAYGLHFHLDRFLKSAATARIEHGYTKEDLRGIILATIAAGGRPKGGSDAFAKFWLSAGRCERAC